MSCTLFAFMGLWALMPLYALVYRLFTAHLYQHLLVDNVTLNKHK